MRRLASFAVALLLAAPVAANPFNQPKGATQVSFTAAIWDISSFFDGEGETQEVEDITQTDFLIGVDHGLSERLTLSLSLPWSISEREILPGDTGLLETNDGVSDATVGLLWRLNDPSKATAYSLLVGLKWPGDYEPDVINSAGDGQFDAELLFSVGHQFQRLTLSADLGYRARSGNPEDEWVARFEGSLLLGHRFVAAAAVDWVDSQGGIGIDETTTTFWPFSRTEDDHLRLSLTGLASVNERVALYAGWASTLDGRSTAKGSQWLLGTALSF